MAEVEKEYDASQDPDYAVRNIPSSVPVITMATGFYPTYRWKMNQENPNTTFPEMMSLRDYRNFGNHMYEPPKQTEKPDTTIQHVTELQPVYHPEDDRWHQVWATRPYTQVELDEIFEGKRQERFSTLNTAYYNAWNFGYKHEISEDVVYTLALSGANLAKLTFLRDRTIDNQADLVPVFFDTQNFINMSVTDFNTFYSAIAEFMNHLESEYIRLHAVITAATNEDELPVIGETLA